MVATVPFQGRHRHHPRAPRLPLRNARRRGPRAHPRSRARTRGADRARRIGEVLSAVSGRIRRQSLQRHAGVRGLPAYLLRTGGAYNRSLCKRRRSMIQFHSLEVPQLERFLERHKAGLTLRSEVDLDLVLRQILQKAYEFVPSESGSILLDDPFRKVASRKDNDLVFIATFGTSSRDLIGQRLSAQRGIVGRVYQTGSPYLSTDVKEDEFFFSDIDEKIGHTTHSVVCVPIYIGKHVCGVLELINRLDGHAFTPRDMTLLEIFAGYTSFTLQNALDARRAHELAKKDDLTGLYNDRWFNVRLTETMADARKTGD